MMCNIKGKKKARLQEKNLGSKKGVARQGWDGEADYVDDLTNIGIAFSSLVSKMKKIRKIGSNKSSKKNYVKLERPDILGVIGKTGFAYFAGEKRKKSDWYIRSDEGDENDWHDWPV